MGRVGSEGQTSNVEFQLEYNLEVGIPRCDIIGRVILGLELFLL